MTTPFQPPRHSNWPGAQAQSSHRTPSTSVPCSAAPEGALAGEMADVLRQHLGVCNALLELAHKEAQALASSDPFPVRAIEVERKALLSRLEFVLKLLAQKGRLWNRPDHQRPAGDARLTRLSRTARDTIMRVLVLDRENEQQLLRRGLLSARCLPPAEQSRPNFVARLYQRHIQS